MPKKIARHELIGSEIEIASSSNPNLKGIKGKIIDETKNMLLIETEKGVKKIIKNQVKMKLNIQKKVIEIEGKKIVGRPEERIKK